ncbi:N-(5'-phosphoribosyl)anthranilate isomerase [Striga asiatica]|uniref:N-(5'-phosphoribosyl)anthranilate isomerase n=1 Tax=Striga asiatica TaxID=4170 RepID=A0A5A7PKC0_STRAF|nr:N-(5'-phosphoribosyl)anthranilate isomerase [Striga asiatica]
MVKREGGQMTTNRKGRSIREIKAGTTGHHLRRFNLPAGTSAIVAGNSDIWRIAAQSMDRIVSSSRDRVARHYPSRELGLNLSDRDSQRAFKVPITRRVR